MPQHLRTGTEVFDGLRGLAILLVLAFHTWLFSWYTPSLRVFGIAVPVEVVPRTGYLGVEIFFCLSGFVLFFPHAVRAVTGSGTTHGARAFAVRRIAKIVPSYALAFAVTAASLFSLHRAVAWWPALWQHAFFVNNFFDDQTGFANSVFWSLAIEAQFYVVFPALALLFRRFPIVAAVFMVAIAVGYRAAVAHCCLADEPIFRQLPAFLDVFGVGMFAAYGLVWIRARSDDSRERRTACTIAAAAALATCWWFLAGADAVQYDALGPQRWDLSHRTLFACAIATFGVASSLALERWRAIVANRLLVFFSLISYNLYLWHTLVLIWLWKSGALPHATPEPHDDPQWRLPFIAIGWFAAILIATAVTYFVERPILATISPQRFAFDWSRLRPALRQRPRSSA